MYRILTVSVFFLLAISSLFAQYTTGFVESSLLANGEVYKLSIPSSGMYMIDQNLANSLNANGNIADIHVYGKRGGVIPQLNETPRIDDLAEIPVWAIGLEDGNWDSGDKVVFHAEGHETWQVNPDNGPQFIPNPYATENYIYIKFDNSPRKQIVTQELITPTNSLTEYQKLQRYENDFYNLLDENDSHSGSGQRWYGDQLKNNRFLDVTDNFDLTNVTSTPAQAIFVAAMQSDNIGRSYYQVGNVIDTTVFGSVNTTNYEGPVGKRGSTKIQDISLTPNANITIDFPQNGDSKSSYWLDYVELYAFYDCRYDGEPLYLTHPDMSQRTSTSFSLTGDISDAIALDITDPFNVSSISINQNQVAIDNNNQWRNIVVSPTSNLPNPTFVNKVENQNLHNLQDVDMVILSPSDFFEAAEKLKQHREIYNGYNVEIVNINHVWEEFGAGKVDPSAIRDFFRMLHTRDVEFRYVVLLGDASFDYRNIKFDDPNYIPTYETEGSLHPITSYPSDDFYAILKPREDDVTHELGGYRDIAIGRLPVNTNQQALDVINKIIHYETSPSCLGPWRTDVTYAADDGDGTVHVSDCDDIAIDMDIEHPSLYQSKVFFDAFKQVSTPGGERYPDASEALVRNFEDGRLVITYLGHGGPKGWAQERVLQIDHLKNLNNYDRLATMITATCTFAGYDNPEIVSAGEEAILNPNGGAVQLLTTVRAVYTGANQRLTWNTWDNIVKLQSQHNMPIGDIIKNAKNSNETSIDNNSKFTLLGDPATRLVFPKQVIVINSLNGNEIGEVTDTLSALEPVNIKGEIRNDGQLNTDFNGDITVRVYDKPSTVNTLVNDSDSGQYTFSSRETLLFNGKASVTNGQFEIDFIIPQDIKFDYGDGKMYFYASDGLSEDASGELSSVIIGGVSDDVLTDNDGPNIKLFMNNTYFKDGGTTDANPILLGYLQDDNGINVSNASIGHNIKITLDEDSQKSYIGNSYYASDVDYFTQGVVTFPLRNLEEGKHVISLTAWDILNNGSTAELNFVVASADSDKVFNAICYPNPVDTYTNFAFEHAKIGDDVTIYIDIYDQLGKKVNTLQYNRYSVGFREDAMVWNNSLGSVSPSELPAGLYYYQVKMVDNNNNASKTSDLERLILTH